MIEPVSTTVNAQGHLVVGGCDVADLAREFGTPLYVLDVETLKTRTREYKALQEEYPNVKIAYASKALSLTALYQILDAEGLYFDVVSDGELFTLLNAGVDPQRAFFHGNNKTQEELAFAIEKGIGCFVLDNGQELDRLEQAMLRRPSSEKIKVFIRYIPEIDAHTHEFIQTGKRDTKFGVLKEDLPGFLDRILANPCFDLQGLHAHIGSQIFDVHPFEVLIERLLDRMVDISRSYDIVLPALSIGGGIGIRYTEQDDPPAIADFVVAIARKMKSYLSQTGYPIEPELILEPGRSLVANAGITLYSIGGIKHIPGIRTYLSVDGGMADNPRPITYGALYHADIATKMNHLRDHVYTIAGKFCESGDVLLRHVHLQKASPDDLLAVYATGAYNYSMSSNYNRYRKPAMVFVEGGKARLVLKRETLEDIIRNDIRL